MSKQKCLQMNFAFIRNVLLERGCDAPDTIIPAISIVVNCYHARDQGYTAFFCALSLYPTLRFCCLSFESRGRRDVGVGFLCCPHCPTQQLALPVSSGTSSHGVSASLSSYRLSQPPSLLTSSLLVQQLNQHWCCPASPVLHLRPLVFFFHH